ncbi:MAG: type II CRISPR RNA-guided endonuclease Cas9 [Chitinophagaceae bacterium]
MENRKKIVLGLDLGTTSIGFAHVIEREDTNQSEIKQIGVRVNPLSTGQGGEIDNFTQGKSISTNADRTLKRGARRTLDRYQDRRKNLIEVLKKANIINQDTILAENGKSTTFQTWELRAKSAVERIEKEELARVFFAISKKRGYKSSRKAKNEDEGQAIDGMAVAMRLYNENLTPGQLVYEELKKGRNPKYDFYRSDLQAEFDKVWNFQKQFYPEVLSNNLKEELRSKNKGQTWKICEKPFGILGFKRQTKGLELKKENYQWRVEGLTQQLDLEKFAVVLQEINGNFKNTSGLLSEISDRSKELIFNKQTVGQYLHQQLQKNRHTRMKNQVFYRQDYLDEFEKIWEVQSQYHSELTDELKTEIRDIIIFYQRKLKSQKGLISFCEFESKEVEINGKKKTIGLKVAPKSSPLFQEFKIWQMLNNVLIRKKESKKRAVKQENQLGFFEEEKEIFVLDLETKQLLFDELNLKGNVKANKIIELLGHKPTDWEIKYSELEGNRTNKSLYEAYLKILDLEGYDVKDLLKVKSNKDEVELDDLNVPAVEIKNMVKDIFATLNISTEILDFNAELDGKAFEEQQSYQLWHLLYSYEGDNSQSGNEKLYELLAKKFGFKKEHSQILGNVAFSDDYGNLSSKAMRKVYPFIKEHKYSDACAYVSLEYQGLSKEKNDVFDEKSKKYRHSKWVGKEENVNRPLDDKLELLKKNSLRNPVVEKILNQMVNVVNSLMEKNRKENPDFRFDEIRIELARELKKNAEERRKTTEDIGKAKTAHDKIIKLLQSEFGIKNPTRNDIIRYRLYEELKNNGYKDLYMNKYIPREILFSKQVDIEHIIPQSRLFDDSFSNKTIVYRETNLDKGNQTAFDYVESKFGNEKAEEYAKRLEALYDAWKKNKEEGISKAKYQKLLKKETEIGDGFIERDLRESQYIAKKAKEMLFKITRSVVSTSGSITDRLREDWDLVNVMKELNLPKYRSLGLIEMQERKFGQKVEVIKDWTKRNDHRHHAMDALTVAFTKHNHIQYLNYLNARKNENHKLHGNIIAIENLETEIKIDNDGNKNRVFKEPIPNFRQVAKEHLENVLISHKAKNKVVTQNINKAKNEVTSIVKDKDGNEKTIKGQVVKTPRGQLHDQTVYGWNWWSRIELNKKISKNELDKIINDEQKQFLVEYVKAKGGIAKAFSDEALTSLEYKGKTVERNRSINSLLYSKNRFSQNVY